jgi:hypothetical protein
MGDTTNSPVVRIRIAVLCAGAVHRAAPQPRIQDPGEPTIADIAILGSPHIGDAA